MGARTGAGVRYLRYGDNEGNLWLRVGNLGAWLRSRGAEDAFPRMELGGATGVRLRWQVRHTVERRALVPHQAQRLLSLLLGGIGLRANCAA